MMEEKMNEKIVQLLKQRFEGEDGAEHYRHAREYATMLMQLGFLKDAKQTFEQIKAAHPNDTESKLMIEQIEGLLH